MNLGYLKVMYGVPSFVKCPNNVRYLYVKKLCGDMTITFTRN